jgi:hypothetical protein
MAQTAVGCVCAKGARLAGVLCAALPLAVGLDAPAGLLANLVAGALHAERAEVIDEP